MQDAKWADTQQNLATALVSLAEINPNPDEVDAYLIRASQAMERALSVLNFDQHAVQWGIAQNSHGMLEYKFAENSDKHDEDCLDHCRRAADAYRASLRVFTKHSYPMQWVSIQLNLANVVRFSALCYAKDADKKRLLTDATGKLNSVMTQLDRETSSVLWAKVKFNLGSTLVDLSLITQNPKRKQLLKEALANYTDAESVFTASTFPEINDMLKANVRTTTWLSAVAEGRFADAEKSLDVVLEEHKEDRRFYEVAFSMLQNDLCNFDRANTIAIRWHAASEDDLAAQVNLLESYVTTGKIEEGLKLREQISVSVMKASDSLRFRVSLYTIFLYSVARQEEQLDLARTQLVAMLSKNDSLTVDGPFDGLREFFKKSRKQGIEDCRAIGGCLTKGNESRQLLLKLLTRDIASTTD